jgi:alanyl-tRNA synthetase
MQQFKNKFTNEDYCNTFTNVQQCLRLTDLDEIGDSTHLLSFQMIGLFSFREWSVIQSIDFFMNFLKRLGIKPDFVTIHPDKIPTWKKFYDEYDVLIKEDTDCLWSDGSIGGYSTEFYINDIEIGNIVNTLGTCIDVGFGLERILQCLNKEEKIKTKIEILEDTCFELIKSGVVVGDNKNSYILKKLIILCIKNGSIIKHPFFDDQRTKIIGNYKNYLRTKSKPKFKNKDSTYWKNTFGIDEDEIEFYEKLEVFKSNQSF